MRVQLFGHTRCILYPPDNAKYLHLYPSIHVSDKQSQVDIYQENMWRQMKTVDEESDVDNSVETETESDFPRFKKAQGRVVDLSPGEVLYIPPYWLVLTESADTELSVGLDVVSVSREQVVLAEGYAMSLPFRNFSNATKQERVLATQVLKIKLLCN